MVAWSARRVLGQARPRTVLARGHGRRWRRPRGTPPPSGQWGRSALDPAARLSVEQMHVATLGREVDHGALFWRGAAVDTSDDRLDLTSGLGGRAIDVCVGAELLDDLDGDGQTLAVSGDGEVFRTDTEGDLLARIRQEGAVDLVDA